VTLDVEEWYHHPGHPYGLRREIWTGLPSTVLEMTAVALDLLDLAGSRATCFFLGCVARMHPRLVREVARRGHEIACHGMNHALLPSMTPEVFREDLEESKAILEDLSGSPVLGYRSPAWSIHGASWAYQVLADAGFAYSSSRLPIPGLGGAFRPREVAEGLREIPALASPWACAPFPAGGTLALRLLPLRLLKACRDGALGKGRPAVYWFHPWELDPGGPVLPGLPAPGRFQRYGLLRRLPGRLRALAGGATRTLGEACTAWRAAKG
jgi:polysaccharide deacetylase family protein (PEP-CTERM system associated)